MRTFIQLLNKVGSANKSTSIYNADKLALRNRELFADTTTSVGGSTGGKAVEIQPRRTMKLKHLHLTKSIYISRIETHIADDDVMEHIRETIPDIDERQYQVRMLDKKINIYKN